MIDAITIEAFLDLSIDIREKYILERAQLKDFWLIGRIKNPYEEKPFFFIENLINPYTGRALESQVFSDFNRPLTIFCRTKGKAMHYVDNTLVAVKFTLTEFEDAVRKGNIFNTSFNKVYQIEDTDEIFDLIGFKKEDLSIIALAMPSLYKDGDSRFVDVAADIIKVKIANDIKILDKKLEDNDRQLSYLKRQEDQIEKTRIDLNSKQEKLKRLKIGCLCMVGFS